MQLTDPAWVLGCCCGHGCWQCPGHLALLTQAVRPAVQRHAASWPRSHPLSDGVAGDLDGVQVLRHQKRLHLKCNEQAFSASAATLQGCKATRSPAHLVRHDTAVQQMSGAAAPHEDPAPWSCIVPT